MWRPSKPEETDAILEMSLALHREDPGLTSVGADQVRATLAIFEREPSRGRAVVLEIEAKLAAYAFLVPFYSNELGGELCVVDELFVSPGLRGRGFGSSLFEAIDAGRFGAFAGIALGVTPNNDRARRLYERLGFRFTGLNMLRSG
jgi:ribosomal protein S18 acetylase RimI-like enzyme